MIYNNRWTCGAYLWLAMHADVIGAVLVVLLIALTVFL